MKKIKFIQKIIIIISFGIFLTSCNNNPEANTSSENKVESSKKEEAKKAEWYENCDGLERSRFKSLLQYGPNEVVGNATLSLLENKVGSYSSYRFHLAGPVEIRNNCQFIVPVKATADIGAPEELLSVRIGWDGKEFYLN